MCMASVMNFLDNVVECLVVSMAVFCPTLTEGVIFADANRVLQHYYHHKYFVLIFPKKKVALNCVSLTRDRCMLYK